MIDHLLRHTLPAAYSLLPAEMASPAASALVLAIGLQESRCDARRQVPQGPARGFFQCERAGVLGVLHHPKTAAPLASVLQALCYQNAVGDASFVHRLLEDNDTLAVCVARLLLWTLPVALPRRDQSAWAYASYLEAWRPGKPRPDAWPAHYRDAWNRVDQLAYEEEGYPA